MSSATTRSSVNETEAKNSTTSEFSTILVNFIPLNRVAGLVFNPGISPVSVVRCSRFVPLTGQIQAKASGSCERINVILFWADLSAFSSAVWVMPFFLDAFGLVLEFELELNFAGRVKILPLELELELVELELELGWSLSLN